MPTTLSRPRAALLLTLLALAALAAAVLTPPANAAPPGDLTLTLSLIEDSDNIVPPGGAARVRATLTSTTSHPGSDGVSGTLRVSGDQEWEHHGRSSYNITPTLTPTTRPNDAAAGADVAVQQRSDADGGDIVAVGAPNDDYFVDAGTTHDKAGSVDLFVDGSFVKRLTAPTPAADALFGHSVDVGGGLIVVGAPGANRAYLYDAAGALVATFTPPTLANLAEFGYGVAIDDAGATIVVGSTAGRGGSALNGAAYFFLKPTAGMNPQWANATATAANSVGYGIVFRGQDKNLGGVVDISGNGQVLIIGAGSSDTSNGGDNKNGAVLVYYRHATTAWTGHNTSPNAILLVPTGMQGIAGIRTGDSVAISSDGREVVAGAAGTSDTANWKGAAFLWVTSGSWSGGINNGIALTDADSADGDRFGHSVAISDSGDRVIVSNAGKQANNYQAGEAHIFDKPATGWAVDDEANAVLTSPQSEAQLFFGSGLALDGENTLVVGQPESTDFLTTDITTDSGRAYTFDLSAADAQASATRLDGPLTCTSRVLDGVNTWTCSVDLQVTPDGGTKQDPRVIVPLGTAEDSFTISASLTITADGRKISDSLVVTVGTVDEADSATFDFATNLGVATTSDDDKPYGDLIAAGDVTRMQLSILSSVGKATAAGNVSSVLFTSSGGGALSLVSSPGAATGSCANSTCQITVSSLNAANSDKIIVQLAHPGAGKSGTATVRAHVISNAGAALEPDPLTVTFVGPVDTIAISEPATGVLNVNTTVTGTIPNANVAIEIDDAETRDRLRLSVSAADKSGNKAATPTNLVRVTITDPDGKPVPEDKIARSFPLTEPAGDDEDTPPAIIRDANGNPQLELEVNAPSTAKLKSGEYTVELRAGGMTTSQTFMVSGDAANIAVSEPAGDLTVNGQFTITATLTDANGATVPDGTPLSFEDMPTGATPVLVNLSRGSSTKDGQATATYLVITAGRGYITVESGAASNAALITTTAAAAAPTEPTNPADSLSRTRANGFTTWLGEGTTTASALLEGLGNGIDTILLWSRSNGQWTRYGIADGREIPGSFNFKIAPGAILWLGDSG